MHAATDIGSAVDWLQSQVVLSSDENGCLAVLHNRNKMVATFGNSEWVAQSEGAVQSKSVTSCAGMTAHFVLLAQTKVGFLSGGRSRRMKELPELPARSHFGSSSQRERQEITPHHTPLSHYLLSGPACHCGRSRLTSSPSSPLPPFAYPHGPACHCGRSRLSIHFPPSLPSHLYTQPSVIPTSKARLVIVAGPASLAPPHSFLLFTPTSLFTRPQFSSPSTRTWQSRFAAPKVAQHHGAIRSSSGELCTTTKTLDQVLRATRSFWSQPPSPYHPDWTLLLKDYALTSAHFPSCNAPNYDDFYHSVITSPDSAPGADFFFFTRLCSKKKKILLLELTAFLIQLGVSAPRCLQLALQAILIILSPLRRHLPFSLWFSSQRRMQGNTRTITVL